MYNNITMHIYDFEIKMSPQHSELVILCVVLQDLLKLGFQWTLATIDFLNIALRHVWYQYCPVMFSYDFCYCFFYSNCSERWQQLASWILVFLGLRMSIQKVTLAAISEEENNSVQRLQKTCIHHLAISLLQYFEDFFSEQN